MPDTEGTQVGTADMHGGGVTFKDRDGNDVSFEVVRLGTTKELETVKAALDEKARAVQLTIGNNDSLRAQVKDALAKAEESSNAYVAEKADSAELREMIGKQGNELADAQEALARMTSERDRVRETNLTLHQQLDEANVGHEAAKAARQAALDANASLTADLENLMSVKALLTETRTALMVKDKELCESREALADVTKANADHIDAHVVLTSELGTARGEVNASRQALADLKAKLRDSATQMRTLLDAMAEKIAGE